MNFKEEWNFHLPILCEVLKERFPDHHVIFKDSIRINDFPKKGIDNIINGCMDFEFSNMDYYQNTKNSKRALLDNLLPGIRLYWNYKQINIYFEKGFNSEVNEKGLNMKVEKSLKIIDTVFQNLK